MNAPRLSPDLLSRFAEIVGERHALREPDAQAAHLVEPRGLWRGRTALVLRPGSTEDVSAILKLAGETGTAVVPQGGNTGLVGGQIPDRERGEIVLSLGRLNRVREVDPAGNTMTLEAGVILAEAQRAADEADRLFPLSLASEGSCQIGGNLSTNAGGTAVIAYGNARDMVLGLEVVLADGRVWNGLRKLRKDNRGYDLKNLFIGAEGTLGIITAAVVKLFPKPREAVTAIAGAPSVEAALRLFETARAAAGPSLTTCELVSRLGLEFVLRHAESVRDPLGEPHEWYVLMELTSPLEDAGLRDVMERILMAAHEDSHVGDAAIADSVGQAGDFWRLREMLSEVQGHEGGSIKHDVSVPIAAVPEFVSRASAAARDLVPGCRPLPFGHLGDGNIHFNVSQPPDADKAEFLARWKEMNAVVHAIADEMGGSFSAEHGIGVLKRDLLAATKDPVEMGLMRDIKRVFDPGGILNPGKVLSSNARRDGAGLEEIVRRDETSR